MTLFKFQGPNHLPPVSHCAVGPGAKTQPGGGWVNGGGRGVTANLLVNKESATVSLKARGQKA